MTEQRLINLLSDESEKFDAGSDQPPSPEVCGWEDNNDPIKAEVNEQVNRFRIRVESRSPLIRSKSSNIYTAVGSCSNYSRSSSPKIDRFAFGKGQKSCNRKRISSFNPSICDEKVPTNAEFRIHKMQNPRRTRKPIKVFRLPRVEFGEEE
jgi:hypothetical protein